MTDGIDSLREPRDQLDDLITAMHRVQRVDHDTNGVETRIQGLIEDEFRRTDAAIDQLEVACTDTGKIEYPRTSMKRRKDTLKSITWARA